MLIPQPVTPQSMPRRTVESAVRPAAIESPQTNGGIVDAAALFMPVRGGLRQVETKLRDVDSAIFAPLAEAFVNLIGSGGKRLRPALALLASEFNGSLQGTAHYNRVVALAASVEMLHTATLVHDDVIDGALLRRGAPTLNARWSGGSTVLAGNYLFGMAARFSAETRNMRAIELFSETLRIIVDGELRQLKDRHNFAQLKENYYQRIFAKTASLFCAATEGAAILSGMPADRVADLRAYGYNFGMAFQIVDDILDFTGDETTLGKPAGSDLRQGTLTLPFFYHLQLHPDRNSVIDRLETAQFLADDGDPDAWQQAVAQAVSELRAGDAIEAARNEARTFLRRAEESLHALPDNVYRHSMHGLCEYVVQRTQ